jgi:hypothetical protein
MEREPDVEIAASVRADEVRFECRPEVRVVPYADAPATVERISERDGLADDRGVAPRDGRDAVAVRSPACARRGGASARRAAPRRASGG